MIQFDHLSNMTLAMYLVGGWEHLKFVEAHQKNSGNEPNLVIHP